VELPVIFAVRVTTAPEAAAVTGALESALIKVAKADAIDEVVLPAP
jgi:hypothetical protein